MSKRIDSSTTEVLSARPASGSAAGSVEAALILGDLSKLTEPQRVSYYLKVCETTGLNPTTKPFDYIQLNGKLVLYATKACAEQLRSNRNVSVEIKSRETVGDCYVVTASAKLPDGRIDESLGAVPVGGLKGDALCNALMKAETKAKRRVTLSICGLGMLDESELDTIKSAVRPPEPAVAAPKVQFTPPVKAEVKTAPAVKPEAKAEAPKVVEDDVPNFPSDDVKGTEPGPFDIVLISGPHKGKKISELSKEEAGFYLDDITASLKAINRPASTLRGEHRDIYYALQNYVFGDKK